MNNWTYLPTLPEERIRVIAADNLSVIGDCFYGHGSAPFLWNNAAHRMVAVPCWADKIWRHSLDERPCRVPTKWMPLPKV
jgi:hypothetical protein